MDNNFNRIKKNTKHKSASVHIPLNPMSASSSSEIMSNRRHYFDGFRVHTHDFISWGACRL